MSRPNQRAQRSLPPKKDEDDDAILGEVVNPQLVNQKVIERFAERDNHEDFERFLKTVNNFTREQAEIAREHAENHPDAKEHRKTKVFRRHQYGILLVFLGVLLLGLPFAPLSAATIFGIVCIVIVCGVLVNARERELDLSGFVKIITAIVGNDKK
jgi:hypothetical protein